MALFYITQQLFSILIILRLKKLYGLISLLIFTIIFFFKADSFDIYSYTEIVNQTQNYELFFEKIIEYISFFIYDDRKVIEVYQIIYLCLTATILFHFSDSKNKLLILAVTFSSVAIMLGVHNNLRQGTASVLILLGIFSFINGNKITGAVIVLSSLGFHNSSIFFIIIIISTSFIFSNIYKNSPTNSNVKLMIFIYSVAILLSFLFAIFLNYFIPFIDKITIVNTNYANYFYKTFDYSEFRTSLALKTLFLLALVLATEFTLKFKTINYKLDLFRFLRIFILFFCIFISFIPNFNEIGNRILYIYYIFELGLMCLLISNNLFNTLTIILIAYAFAFNVWNILGGI